MEERRQEMTQLHERVATLEAISIETRDDVKALVRCITGDNGERSILGRIADLEHWKNWANGVSAAIGGIFTVVIAWLGLRKG